MTPVFTHRLSEAPNRVTPLVLSLTAEERGRSRHHFTTTDGQTVYLQLPRGTVLQDGDLLQSESKDLILQVQAKPEAVLTVQADTSLDLLRAAYHLGNRHVALEITSTCLRLSTDPVLRDMLEQRGLAVTEERCPFQPEMGAYGHHH